MRRKLNNAKILNEISFFSSSKISRSLSDNNPFCPCFPGIQVSFIPMKKSAFTSFNLVLSISPTTTWSRLGGITPIFASSNPASNKSQYSFSGRDSVPSNSTNLSIKFWVCFGFFRGLLIKTIACNLVVRT